MSNASSVQATPAATLREQWQAATTVAVWLRPNDWYHPAVDALTEALCAGTCPRAAGYRLGEVRGASGVGIAETIDDVTVLYDLVAAEPGLDLVRSLCEGWADAAHAAPVQATCMDPESGLPTLEYLSVRLGETYGAARRHGLPVHETHCLVMVDVAVADLAPWRRMARSAAMGRALTSALLPGHPMAALGGGAFALLLERDGDLGERVRRLRDEVNSHATLLQLMDLLRQPPRIWIEPLPETHERAAEMLTHLRR
ncbi:hypothetical protein [Actinotalea sp. K2]|uniref:hypothetical protein n=1 Tax=Actinotalea sp. K2 TaxID=2939438 RepID=UPI0020173D99|nr:hypothetical protein [Actinotalea sp. K2]MCL3859732.1 hypothetical protein [Actinotalea sp. K2]